MPRHIQIDGNYVSVGIDNKGVYSVVNTWRKVKAVGKEKFQKDKYKLSLDEAQLKIEKDPRIQDAGELASSQVVYAPRNGNKYSLQYKFVYEDGTAVYVDCQNGKVR